MIYFIQCGNSLGPIKIGYTENLAGRVSQLQAGNPYPLFVLKAIEGTVSQEQCIQAKFHELCIRGEWFTPSQQLISFIEEAGPEITVDMASVMVEGEKLKEEKMIGIDFAIDYRLLTRLEQDCGKLVTYQELIHSGWGEGTSTDELMRSLWGKEGPTDDDLIRSLSERISYLRRRLDSDLRQPLQSVYGKGYILHDCDAKIRYLELPELTI
jgi:hypothetical protein